jgi:hypothetical protein
VQNVMLGVSRQQCLSGRNEWPTQFARRVVPPPCCLPRRTGPIGPCAESPRRYRRSNTERNVCKRRAAESVGTNNYDKDKMCIWVRERAKERGRLAQKLERLAAQPA